MSFNYKGDLYKREIVEELQERGFDVSSVHELNLVLEEMGLLEHSGDRWMTTDEGVPYTIYQSKCDADAWHSSVIDEICDYLS